MASLTLTIDDTKIARYQVAYGVASNAALKTAIIADIRKKVIAYETDQVRLTEFAVVKTANQTADSNVQAAIVNAEAQIVIT